MEACGRRSSFRRLPDSGSPDFDAREKSYGPTALSCAGMGCHSELPCECDQISSFNKWACLEWSLSVNGQMAALENQSCNGLSDSPLARLRMSSMAARGSPLERLPITCPPRAGGSVSKPWVAGQVYRIVRHYLFSATGLGEAGFIRQKSHKDTSGSLKRAGRCPLASRDLPRHQRWCSGIGAAATA